MSRRIEWRLRFGSVLVACTMVVPVAAQESARTEPPTGPSTSGPNACTSSDSFLECSPPDLFGMAALEPTLVFDQIGQPAPVKPEEMKLAQQVIATFEGPLDLANYKDEYREASVPNRVHW